MMSKETLELYSQWFKQLTENEVRQVIKAALGEDEPRHELLIENVHKGLKYIYVGYRKSEERDKLWADKNCPYFTLNDKFHIGFHIGGYAEDNKLLLKKDIEEFESTIDRMSAYACLHGIVTRHEVEVMA